jgi:hypothetical protein
MNAWDHLPNAVHIDRVIASANAYPELWKQAWYQVGNLEGNLEGNLAWVQAWKQGRDQARNQALDQVCYQAKGVVLALITYDDCAKYLDIPLDQLEMLYHLTEHPACILLQPAVLVFAMERELA